MPAPKGHLPYAGCEKGGLFGYLGKPEDAYTLEDIKKIGDELLRWYAENPMEIWIDEFFAYRGIKVSDKDYFLRRYPVFHEYYNQAKAIQVARLHKYSFWKKGDWNVSKFVLYNNHSGYENIYDNDKKTENKQSLSPEILDALSILMKNPELIKVFNQKQNVDF